MPCLGNAPDHCCYVNGIDCKFLEVNTVEGRKWACGLRRELGDWDLVLDDPRYQEHVQPVFGELNCRDYPDGEGINRGICKECGCN